MIDSVLHDRYKTRMDTIPQMDIAGAKAALEEGETLFLDIRDPDSFQEAHIPGAVHVSDANVGTILRETEKERPILIYCYHGHNSQGGAAYFLDQGFTHVHSLVGGFEEWRTAGNDCE